MSQHNKVCLRLKRNPKLYYNQDSDQPSIYPTVFEYGEISELQNQRRSGLYDEITNIPKITASEVYKYKTIRASSLVHYGNKFDQQLAMWDKHPLSPNYKPVDSDATNIGSFIHLLFEYDGEPSLDTFILNNWGTSTRVSKKFEAVREEYGYGKPIINEKEYDKYKALYPRVVKELALLGVDLGVSSENTRYEIGNFLDTGWAFAGTLDRVQVTSDGFHDLIDIKSVEPSKLSDWESGSYALAKKFNQLEGYRNLYSIKNHIPLEKIRVKFILVLRSIATDYLGSCVRVLEPAVQYTPQKQHNFENMFKAIATFFEDRINNKPLGVELVKYNSAPVRLAFDFKKYNLVFDTLDLLCRQNEISFVEGEDYFDAGEYKVLTHKLLIKILFKMGYHVNPMIIRKGDYLSYKTDKDGFYIRKQESYAPPSDPILYHACEILETKTYKIIKTQSYSDAEVQEHAKRYSSISGKKFWAMFYEQMATVTVIKHAIRGFMQDNLLLQTFYKLEQLTYEGLED